MVDSPESSPETPIASPMEFKTAGVTFEGRVILNQRITSPDAAEDVRHLEFEAPGAHGFEPGQHLAVHVPGPHAFGNRQHTRLYTLSGADEFPGRDLSTLQICVRRCTNVDEFSGEAYRGIASHYLCDLEPGSQVKLTGPYGSPFRVPDDASTPLVMIGLGTGIAPFRHFVRHIYDTLGGWEGPVRLFFGAHSGLEMLYMNDHQHDFSRYYDERTFRAFEAVSPRPYLGEPAALAESLLAHRMELEGLLEEAGTRVYVAGVASIRRELEKAFVTMSGSEKKWRELRNNMSRDGRWTEIIY